MIDFTENLHVAKKLRALEEGGLFFYFPNTLSPCAKFSSIWNHCTDGQWQGWIQVKAGYSAHHAGKAAPFRARYDWSKTLTWSWCNVKTSPSKPQVLVFVKNRIWFAGLRTTEAAGISGSTPNGLEMEVPLVKRWSLIWWVNLLRLTIPLQQVGSSV